MKGRQTGDKTKCQKLSLVFTILLTQSVPPEHMCACVYHTLFSTSHIKITLNSHHDPIR